MTEIVVDDAEQVELEPHEGAALDQQTSTEELLDAAELQVEPVVAAALAATADQFLDVLVASGEPIDPTAPSRLSTIWEQQMLPILGVLEQVYTGTANAVRRNLGQLAVPVSVLRQQYLETATNRLRDVGDSLWETARQTLADGNLAGEGYDQLRDRLRATFAADGAQLGESRAERIARTEVQSAVNRGTQESMATLASEIRPMYKVWLATYGPRTRPAHARADGQVVPIDQPFLVMGESMQYPGDPAGSAANVIQCRCTTIYTDDPEFDVHQPGRESQSALVVDFCGPASGGVCEAMEDDLGASSVGDHLTAAANHDGAMLALIPSDADLDRIVLDGGEPRDDLHLTLLFLGEADEIPAEVLDTLQADTEQAAAAMRPIDAQAFAAAMFNPTGESPCWVLNVGGEELSQAHLAALAIGSAASEDGWTYPEQHHPWAPHITLTYTDDENVVEDVVSRVGPITFDRLRLAVGGHVIDYPLGGSDQEEADMQASNTETVPEARFSSARIRGATLVDIPAFIEARIQIDGPSDENGMQPWSGVLTVEDVPTGDGRIYLADSFRWENPGGGWPLRWDVEDDGMHLGAVTVGTIYEIERDGNLIRGRGVFDTNIPNGLAAAGLVERGTVTGVSIDMDDIPEDSVEIDYVLDASATLAVVGQADLPLADRDREWSGDTAASNVLAWATDDDGLVDASRLAQAFFYRDDDDNPETLAAYSLGFADVVDGELQAVPRGVFAVAGVLQGARGGVDLGEDVQDQIRGRVNAYYAKMAQEFEDPSIAPPWTEIEAAAVGSDDLALAGESTDWDATEAHNNLAVYAADFDPASFADFMSDTHFWQVDDGDREDPNTYRLPFADVLGGISSSDTFVAAIPAGIDWAVGEAERMLDDDEITAEDFAEIMDTASDYLERLGDDEGTVEVDVVPDEIEATAWSQFAELPTLPAEAFADPSDILSDTGQEIGYKNGRIWGWVAQNGVCHDAFSGNCVTPPKKGTDLDTFNRQTVRLDDGSTLKVGVFTMDAGHDNDGAEAGSFKAQFDNTRTVAGLVRVGISDRGTWFSGIAAPWLSEWDRQVLTACRPSGHWKRLRNGRWSLRAVLSVPVPGFPNRVAASAAVDRANMALVASAAVENDPTAKKRSHVATVSVKIVPEIDDDLGGEVMSLLASSIVDELERRSAARQELAEMEAYVSQVRSELVASMRNDLRGELA